MYITVGTLAEGYTGGVVTLAHDEMVYMLLLQAKVATEAGRVVNLYRVISTILYHIGPIAIWRVPCSAIFYCRCQLFAPLIFAA